MGFFDNKNKNTQPKKSGGFFAQKAAQRNAESEARRNEMDANEEKLSMRRLEPTRFEPSPVNLKAPEGTSFQMQSIKNETVKDVINQEAEKEFQRQQAEAKTKSMPVYDFDKVKDRIPNAPMLPLPGRDIPVLGTVLLRGLDKLASNPVSEAVAEYTVPDAPLIGKPETNARDQFLLRSGQEPSTGAAKLIGQIAAPFFTPGAGLGTGKGLYEGLAPATQILSSKIGTGLASKLESEAVPLTQKIGDSLVTRVSTGAAKEAIVGAGLGAGQALATGDGNLKDVATNAAFGAGLGAVAGAAAPAIGAAIKKVKPGGFFSKTVNEVNENIPSSETGAIQEPQQLVREEPPIQQNVDAVETKIESPQKGTRANFNNQLKNGQLSNELQQKINDTDKSYDIITNEASVNAANEAVKDLPKAEANFLLNQSGGPDHIATGYRLMQKLDALGEHERALNVSRKLAEDLTKSGQTSQAASILSRLSPEGQLLNLVRTAEKNGKTVSVEDSIKFKDLAARVQENSQAGTKANQFNDILNRMEKGENISVDDLKKLSDYLSSAEKIAKKKVKVVDDVPKELNDVRKRDRIISYLDDAEQAALARIAARKNRLNSLPVDEWADHIIVASAQIAKGTIKAATHVEDLVKQFGEEIRPVATEIFQKAQEALKKVSPSVDAGDIERANQAFRRLSGEAQNQNTTLQEKIVEKYLKENPQVRQKDIDTLRELAKNVTRLSGDSRTEADIAMQKILNSYEKSSAWDKVQALRYMAMLLNSATQALNAASGPIMTATGKTADVFGTMLDISISKLLNKPRTTTLYGSNPLSFIADYLKGLKVGGKAGWLGVNPAGIQSTNEIRGLAFKSLKNPLGLAERTLGAVAKGPDYATYSAVYNSEMKKQAYLDAINSGIKRSDKKAINNHIEQFLNEPSEAAMDIADKIAKNTTFQRSDTTGGQIANTLNSFSGKAKVLKPVTNTIFPFVRTPINIASTAVTMTPAGIIKGLFQLTSKSAASQREAIRTLSLGITGSGIGAVGYYLSQIGIITGANDSGNKDVDAIREQAGLGKYRFNTSALKRYLTAMLNGDGKEAAEQAARYQEGDTTFDYNKLQPIAFPLAAGASLGKNENKSLRGQFGAAAVDSYGSLYGMSTLKGVQDIFQPSYGGTIGEKALGTPTRIAESFFKSFSPSLLAQEARRQDPIARKTPYNDGLVEDVTGYFKSRLPGLSKTLPPNKTTLGMDKMNAPGVIGQYLNPYKAEVSAYNKAAVIISNLIDKTGDYSLAPSSPDKSVRGKNKNGEMFTIQIPQDRYEQLQEEVGHAIIAKIMSIPSGLSDAKKAERIRDIYSEVNKKERNKVKKELGIKVSD